MSRLIRFNARRVFLLSAILGASSLNAFAEEKVEAVDLHPNLTRDLH